MRWNSFFFSNKKKVKFQFEECKLRGLINASLHYRRMMENIKANPAMGLFLALTTALTAAVFYALVFGCRIFKFLLIVKKAQRPILIERTYHEKTEDGHPVKEIHEVWVERSGKKK